MRARTSERARRLSLGVTLGLGASLSGCAGGMPLLHPAQVLPPGDVRAVGGGSAHVAVGGTSSAINSAVSDIAQNPGPVAGDVTYAKGAIVTAAVGPGLAPFVGMRVGVPNDFEGGLTYTGRGVRVDMRHAFTLSQGVALSIGAGGTAILYGQGSGTILPGIDTSEMHGYGGDIPVLIGYESPAGILHAWAGARVAYEHVTISQVLSDPTQQPLFANPLPLSADHTSAGGLIGFSVGFRHIHLAVELDAAYENVRGSFNGASATVAGVSMTPGAAVLWNF